MQFLKTHKIYLLTTLIFGTLLVQMFDKELAMVISGSVEEIIFHNEDNGYTVLVLEVQHDYITCVGKFPNINEGEWLELEGDYIKHAKYGVQFQAKSVRVTPPNNIDGIIRYLSSGLIKGVGPITATALVEKFGETTLQIIEYNPQRLTEVKGISAKKAQDIAESFAKIKNMQDAIMMMQTYHISTNLAIKIFNFYGDKTETILKNNPYRMTEEVDGIGFLTADKIAQNMGIAPTSAFRIRAGLFHVLRENSEKNGNTYIPYENLVEEVKKALRLEQTDLQESIDLRLKELEIDGQIKILQLEDTKIVMLQKMYQTERMVAQLLTMLNSAVIQPVDVSQEISIYEQLNHITMHDKQKDAVDLAVNHGVSVITGGPGTGKTTIIKCILQVYKSMGKRVKLLAPTGRAAKRLSESTGMEASTIHRALELDYTSPTLFFYHSGNKLPFDVIIIDEVSMVDVQLLFYLLRAVHRNARVILVGDKDQLPSVGAGNVLADILKSGVIPVMQLTQIYRQDDKSLIVTNAHLINEGKMPIIDNKSKDFFFEPYDDTTEMLHSIIALETTRIPKYLGIEPDKIQVLAPMRAGICGVENLNVHLQDALNPSSIDKAEIVKDKTIFRLGDRVMQTSNNYERQWNKGLEHGTGVFNGDIGMITKVDRHTQSLEITFEDGRVATYLSQEVGELVLSYAITIHKSQGSEFDVVIIPVISGAYMLLTRNLLYTAVTRAKKMVVLVGSKKSIAMMVHNNYTAVRYSMLSTFLLESKSNMDALFGPKES